MNDENFQKLVLSVKQMGTIMQGGKLAHRRTTQTDLNVKELREPEGPVKRRRAHSAGGSEHAS